MKGPYKPSPKIKREDENEHVPLRGIKVPEIKIEEIDVTKDVDMGA